MALAGVRFQLSTGSEEGWQVFAYGGCPAVDSVSELHRSAFPLRVVDVHGTAVHVLLSDYGVTAKGL